MVCRDEQITKVGMITSTDTSRWHGAYFDSHNIYPLRILIFSHFSDRDGVELLRVVKESLDREGLEIKHLILTTYNERQDRQTRIGIYA